jgi:hypothetical protein
MLKADHLCLVRSRLHYATLAGLVLVAACATPEVATVSRPAASASNATLGPSLSIGTHVVVRLDEPIDTETSRAGQLFRASVDRDVRSPQGALLVARGASLVGHVVSVGTPFEPKIRLSLDTITTVNGLAAIQAAVRHAQRTTYPGPEAAPTNGDTLCHGSATETDPFCDSYLYRIDTDGYSDHGFGETPPTDDRPVEIRLPRGARIELVLTQPVVPPEAQSATAGLLRVQ